MIDRTGGVDKTFGVHFSKIYRVSGADRDGRPAGGDAVTISKFSALVERGRACAMALPDVRADRVSEARASLSSGDTPAVDDVAAAMINSMSKGQV